MKKHTSLLSPALAAGAFFLASCGGAETPPPDTKALSCAELKGMVVPVADIHLPTTGATVTSAEVMPASGEGAAALGEYCKVQGVINPVDSSAPKINFLLNLPTEWNKKAMMFGGGGYDGELLFLNVVHSGAGVELTPQGRGYAVFNSDSGHTQMPPFIFGRDASFALNDEALKNFAGDALKKTHDAALFLIRARYAEEVQKTYFQGGSSGGREALEVAQKWPEDFDGVISLLPFWNSASGILQFGRITRALAAPGAYLNVPKRKLALDAGTAACDELDGVKDGVISNVAGCAAAFDLATAVFNGNPLRCPGGTEGGDTCLSDPQIAALTTWNTPSTFSYALASGETQYPGFNILGTDLGIPSDKPGLEIWHILGLNTLQPAHPMTVDMPYFSVFYDQWVKYFVTQDASFDSLQLDPENPGKWEARISALSSLQDINKTDLSAFEARGGKLLMAHGSADALVSTRATAQYYEGLKKTMGADKVANFVRYYEIPGYGHGTSAVFNAGWDSVTALESWVEKGTAPQNMTVVDKTGVVGRTRPLCEYPGWPKYKGSGDVNLAASFTCVTP